MSSAVNNLPTLTSNKKRVVKISSRGRKFYLNEIVTSRNANKLYVRGRNYLGMKMKILGREE